MIQGELRLPSRERVADESPREGAITVYRASVSRRGGISGHHRKDIVLELVLVIRPCPEDARGMRDEPTIIVGEITDVVVDLIPCYPRLRE